MLEYGYGEKHETYYYGEKAVKCKGCHEGMLTDGWCDGRAKGFAAGQETSCKPCHAAMLEDGWCEAHNQGLALYGMQTSCKSCHQR